MDIPTLCIIQARLKSTRLPGKMLLKLGGETLVARAWRIACEAFGRDNCVVAIPAGDQHGPLGDELRRIAARVFSWPGAEEDVLERFWACAHSYRWHPDTVVIRYTPDDHRKDLRLLRMVAQGARLPVELGGEAFTLAQLDAAHARLSPNAIHEREHITWALFPVLNVAEPLDHGVWTVDTLADYEAARRHVGDVASPPGIEQAGRGPFRVAHPGQPGHAQPTHFSERPVQCIPNFEDPQS